MGSFRQRLLDEMVAVPTVDCHSHTLLRREYEAVAAEERNLFTITSYFRRDEASIVELGHERSLAGARSDEERWQRLKPIIGRAQNVSYYRHNIATYQGLFDFADDDLTDDNWAALNARIKEWTARPGWYDHVTREKCNLVTQIRNVPWYEDWEPEYFTATLRMEPAIRDGSLLAAAQRAPFEAHMNREFSTVAALKQGLADYVDGYVDHWHQAGPRLQPHAGNGGRAGGDSRGDLATGAAG